MVQMQCPSCQALFRLSLRADLVEKEQTGQSRHSIQVVVAVDGEATREIIREVLAKAGYEALEASTGRGALSLLEKHSPSFAVLDVGLPQMFGFEVCEVIKRKESLKSVKVILVAAIHDKDTYKREPRTLYGADDYIERHRLQEELVPKIEKLLNQKKLDVLQDKQQKIAQERPVSQQSTPSLQKTPQPLPKAGNPVNITPEHEAAMRLARIIVSDIALYNPERVKEALQKNNFYETLKEEIEEGKKLYNERVSATIRSTTDYFQDAVENFIKSKVKPQG
jgi:DNA-binding response OmpR family regulator